MLTSTRCNKYLKCLTVCTAKSRPQKVSKQQFYLENNLESLSQSMWRLMLITTIKWSSFRKIWKCVRKLINRQKCKRRWLGVAIHRKRKIDKFLIVFFWYSIRNYLFQLLNRDSSFCLHLLTYLL